MDKITLAPIKKKSIVGLGCKGELKKSITGMKLIERVKKVLNIDALRYIGDLQKKIKKIAMVPGSGGSFLSKAKAIRADAYITADVKHHTALEAHEEGIFLIDPDHYPSECLLIPGWAKMIRDVTKEVEILESEISTNPFHYA